MKLFFFLRDYSHVSLLKWSLVRCRLFNLVKLEKKQKRMTELESLQAGSGERENDKKEIKEEKTILPPVLLPLRKTMRSIAGIPLKR